MKAIDNSLTAHRTATSLLHDMQVLAAVLCLGCTGAFAASGKVIICPLRASGLMDRQESVGPYRKLRLSLFKHS